MSKILVLSGENHRFNASAEVIHDFLSKDADITATLTDDKGILAASDLNTYDACVFGTGFTRTERREDGSVERVSDLTPLKKKACSNLSAKAKGWSESTGPHGGSAVRQWTSSGGRPIGIHPVQPLPSILRITPIRRHKALKTSM